MVNTMDMKNLETPEISWNISNTGLDNFGTDKTNSLNLSITELKQQIAERENLSKLIIDEISKEKRDLDNFLFSIDAKNESSNADEIREKIALRQKRVELSEFQLREKIVCWQDVAKLKQELREKEQELSERENRMSVLKDVLEG
jgi:hypothetical protein